MAQGNLKTLFLIGLLQLTAAADSHVAWVAGPFGDCVDTGADCKGHVQLREVECTDVFTGQPADGCAGTKPLAHQPCIVKR